MGSENLTCKLKLSFSSLKIGPGLTQHDEPAPLGHAALDSFLLKSQSFTINVLTVSKMILLYHMQVFFHTRTDNLQERSQCTNRI